MSSSFKQKKLKTLATRKKTKKRKLQSGMTLEDDSGRLFQPPSQRDPRWKKPSANEVVSRVMSSFKMPKRTASNDDDEEEEDDDQDDELEIVQQSQDESDDQPDNYQEEEEDDDAAAYQEEAKHGTIWLGTDLDKCLKKMLSTYKAIRSQDGRHKAKVLFVVDSNTLFNGLKKELAIKREAIKPKSRLGVGSSKKPTMAYRNVGLLKTPLDRFQVKNKELLQDFKCGKVPTLVAQDQFLGKLLTEIPVQHVFFASETVLTVLRLDLSMVASGSTDGSNNNNNNKSPPELHAFLAAKSIPVPAPPRDSIVNQLGNRFEQVEICPSAQAQATIVRSKEDPHM